MTAARRLADLEDAAAVGRRAAERALRRLGARRVATCEVPVIFDPVTAPSLLGHLAACVERLRDLPRHELPGRAAGRERSRATLVTMIDDGRRARRASAASPSTARGSRRAATCVLDDGHLRELAPRQLLRAQARRRLHRQRRARPGQRAPVAPTNLWLEPGERTLEEIIAETERGLLVTELIGMGFKPVTGDYSRGAAGLWIEDGEIALPVEEITIAGNLRRDAARDRPSRARDLLWLGRTASPLAADRSA